MPGKDHWSPAELSHSNVAARESFKYGFVVSQEMPQEIMYGQPWIRYKEFFCGYHYWIKNLGIVEVDSINDIKNIRTTEVRN